MNIRALFKRHYLTECPFCFEPVDRVELLIVSHEGKTSICNHCAQISVEQVGEQRLKRETDAAHARDVPVLSAAEADAVPADPDTPTPGPEGRNAQSPPADNAPDGSQSLQ